MPTFDAAALIFNGLRKVTPSNPRSGANDNDRQRVTLRIGSEEEQLLGGNADGQILFGGGSDVPGCGWLVDGQRGDGAGY